MSSLINQVSERGVIAALMSAPQMLDEIVTVLGATRDAFGTEMGFVYEAILDLDARGMAIDKVTITDWLAKHTVGQETALRIVGDDFFDDLASLGADPLNITDYARAVRDTATARKLMTVGTMAVSWAYQYQNDPDHALDMLEREIERIRSDQPGIGVHVMDIVDEYRTKFEERLANPGQTIGHKTKIATLDHIIGSLEPTRQVIIAGRPGMGKTMLAADLTLTLSNHGHVVFVSAEMSRLQMMGRLLSRMSGVDGETLRLHPHLLSQDQLQRLYLVLDHIKSGKIPITFFCTSMNVVELRAQVKRLKQKLKNKGIPLAGLVVDYLQLLHRPPGYEGGDNAVQATTENSRQLKLMAGEEVLDCPVITVSQLSRACELRSDKRPILSDLRESGAIEQDADIVIFSYSDIAYMTEKDRANTLRKYETNWAPWELIVAKNRDGRTGTADVLFNRSTGQFRALQEGVE